MRALHLSALSNCNTLARMTTLTLRSDHEKLVDALDDFRFWMPLPPPLPRCLRRGGQEQTGAAGDLDAAGDEGCAGGGG